MCNLSMIETLTPKCLGLVLHACEEPMKIQLISMGAN
jgi:hypothetical protein